MALEHAILVSLLEKPGSGYELARRFERSIGYFWTATHQQIYRVLKRMESAGLLAVRELSQRSRPDKKEYSVVGPGRAALSQWLHEPIQPENIRHELGEALASSPIARRRVRMCTSTTRSSPKKSSPHTWVSGPRRVKTRPGARAIANSRSKSGRKAPPSGRYRQAFLREHPGVEVVCRDGSVTSLASAKKRSTRERLLGKASSRASTAPASRREGSHRADRVPRRDTGRAPGRTVSKRRPASRTARAACTAGLPGRLRTAGAAPSRTRSGLVERRWRSRRGRCGAPPGGCTVPALEGGGGQSGVAPRR